MATGKPNTLELLDANAMADLLGVTRKTLYARLSRNPKSLPPFVKLGRTFYWRASTIDAWLAEREGDTRLKTASGQ